MHYALLWPMDEILSLGKRFSLDSDMILGLWMGEITSLKAKHVVRPVTF